MAFILSLPSLFFSRYKRLVRYALQMQIFTSPYCCPRLPLNEISRWINLWLSINIEWSALPSACWELFLVLVGDFSDTYQNIVWYLDFYMCIIAHLMCIPLLKLVLTLAFTLNKNHAIAYSVCTLYWPFVNSKNIICISMPLWGSELIWSVLKDLMQLWVNLN